MLKTRVLSSLVILPPVLGAAWWGGIPFVILLVLCGGLMAWELYRLARAPAGAGSVWCAALGAATPLVMLFFGYEYVFPWVVAATAIAWLLLRRASLTVTDLAGIVALNVLILLTLISAGWIRLEMIGGRETLLWLIAVIAATDIGAYFSGRAIGGPRLAPRISPNKTWAGLIGGMLLAALTGYLVARLAMMSEGGEIAIASAVVAVVSQAGDLGESWVKRRMGTKDSGTLLPGHGGILDRVDGYLTATPLVALIALLHRGVF